MNQLLRLRQQIDRLDKMLMEILAKRFSLSGKIQKYKGKKGLSSSDRAREKKILQKVLKNTGRKLPKKLVIELYRLILSYSKR